MRANKPIAMLFILLGGLSGSVFSEDLLMGPALKGAWFNPDMTGQGFFVEVYEQPPVLFVGWFGFPRPSEGAAMDPVAHRWYTLEGSYSGSSVIADIFQTTGGMFAAEAPVEQEVIGSAVIHFSDCNHGTVDYQFDGAEEGSIAISRIVPVPESDCDDLQQADAVPDQIERQQTTVFDHVSVLQMPAATMISDQMVVVREGLITHVGIHDEQMAPAGAIRVDGRGRYLIPGLVDTHTHLANHAPEVIRHGIVTNELLQYMANGVTTILVPGNSFNAQPYNELTGTGAMWGPLIYDAKWVFSQQVGGRREPSTAAEARAVVRAAANDGYAFMKFFDLVSKEVTFAILDESAALGMPTVAHFQETVTPVEALDRGLNLVAHIQEFGFDYLTEQDDETRIQQAITDMLRNQASVTSTLVIDELTAQVAGNNQAGIDEFWARPELAWLSPDSITVTELAILTLSAMGEQAGDYDEELAFLRKLTRELHTAGVPVLMGTDAPGSGAVPGFEVHREIQALLNCDIALPEVLRISTWNGARFIYESLNLTPRFGAIRDQWRADLVLLNRNPLLSAKNLEDVAGVMANGSWLSGQVLSERMEIIADSYGSPRR